MTSLTKKNFKWSCVECRALVARFGVEAERHLVKNLFSRVDFAHETKKELSLQQQVRRTPKDVLPSVRGRFNSCRTGVLTHAF